MVLTFIEKLYIIFFNYYFSGELSGPYLAETLIQKDIEKTAFEGNVLDFVWREWF